MCFNSQPKRNKVIIYKLCIEIPTLSNLAAFDQNLLFAKANYAGQCALLTATSVRTRIILLFGSAELIYIRILYLNVQN